MLHPADVWTASSESTTDTSRPPGSGGQPTDSNPAVPLEGGPASAHAETPSPLARSQSHAAAALSGCARAEASLGTLLRGVQHLAAAVSSAREAKADVVQELDTLGSLLGEAEEQQLVLRHRVALLEHALDRTEREAGREKAFLVEEQDTFIASLWDDHSQELTELRRRLALAEKTLRQSQDENRLLSDERESTHREFEKQTLRLRKAEADVARLEEGSRDQRGRLRRAQLEREEAQLATAQALRERDQLRAELGQLKAAMTGNPKARGRVSTMPTALLAPTQAEPGPSTTPPPPMRSEVGRFVAESARMTAARMDRDLEAPRSPSQMADLPRQPSVPPAAITSLVPSPKPAPLSAGHLKPKPDPSTRPLIGYSLNEDLPEERLENPRPSSQPPR